MYFIGRWTQKFTLWPRKNYVKAICNTMHSISSQEVEREEAKNG